MHFHQTFQKEIIKELDSFLAEQNRRFPKQDILTIDLHVHDHNSDVPDDVIGRLLNISETYLATDGLMDTLKKNGCDTFTVTNHNNARSCYEMQERGMDVLTGAEFSCFVPDFKVNIHVLAYGFTPSQEKELNRLRKDIYKFQKYTKENDIPTIWAHPLYHYKRKGLPTMKFFEKMALLFERFEGINGQRDTWQNMLLKKWIETLTPKKIREFSAKYKIPADRYCRDPYRKCLSGGSDCHMGIFAGLSGTRLHVPDLKKRLMTASRSELALEAIKECRMAPFGSHADHERMIIIILEYVCQIGLNIEDPGLLHILLHKGEAQQKLLSFIITNAFMELKRHRLTNTFLEVFHESFMGITPGFSKRMFVGRPLPQHIQGSSENCRHQTR